MKISRINIAALVFALGTISLLEAGQAQQTIDAAEVKTTAPDEIKYRPAPFVPGAEAYPVDSGSSIYGSGVAPDGAAPFLGLSRLIRSQ